jgi:hypothetical protein
VQKKVLAHDLKQAIKAEEISPSEMARRMRTSREAVYRLSIRPALPSRRSCHQDLVPRPSTRESALEAADLLALTYFSLMFGDRFPA